MYPKLHPRTLVALIVVSSGLVVSGAPAFAVTSDVTVDVTHSETRSTQAGSPYELKLDVPHVNGASTVDRAISKFIDDAKRQFLGLVSQPAPGGASGGANTLVISVDGTFTNARVVSIQLSESVDVVGEAHGSFARASLTYDRAAGERRLGLDDLLIAGRRPQLAGLLSSLFPADHSTTGAGGCASDPATIVSNLAQSGPAFDAAGPAAALSANGLVVGFQDASLGPHAASCGTVVITVPYQVLDGVLKPEYVSTTSTPGSPSGDEAQLGTCDVQSVALQVAGNITAFSLNLSGEAAVEEVTKSDDTYRLKVSEGLGIGVKAIFGEGANLGGAVGVKADVSAGLKIKAGATSSPLGKPVSTQLLDAIVNHHPPPADLTVALAQPSQVFVEAGVFLNGSVTVGAPGGPSGSLSVGFQAAVGFSTTFQNGKPTGETVYFSASGNLTASGSTGALFAPLSMSATQDFGANTKLSASFDTSGTPTGISLSVGADASTSDAVKAGQPLPKVVGSGKLSFGATATAGQAVDYTTIADVARDPRLQQTLTALLQAALADGNDRQLPIVDEATLLRQLNGVTRSTLLVSDITKLKGNPGAEFGDVIGFGVDVSATVVAKRLRGAFYALPGSDELRTWVACTAAAAKLGANR